MTDQEIFDHVSRFLLQEQKGGAYKGESCRYRAPNGNKCAIGCLIPNELYEPIYEGRSAEIFLGTEYLDSGLKDSKKLKILREQFKDNEAGFLMELQAAHDDIEEFKNNPIKWATALKDNLRGVASSYGLDASVLDNL